MSLYTTYMLQYVHRLIANFVRPVFDSGQEVYSGFISCLLLLEIML